MSDRTILVIDYEPRTLEIVRPSLEKQGYSVATAKDGVSGIDAFKSLEPELTLIEYMLPRMPGLEVCRALRATPHGERAAVVIMGSRFKARQYRYEAKQRYKADDFLEKPFTEETLLAVVRNLLRSNGPEPVLVEAAQALEAAVVKPAAAPEPKSGDSEFEAEVVDRLDAVLGDL